MDYSLMGSILCLFQVPVEIFFPWARTQVLLTGIDTFTIFIFDFNMVIIFNIDYNMNNPKKHPYYS